MQLEVGEVGLRRVQRVPVVDPALRMRPAERDELLGHQPVEVAILKQKTVNPSRSEEVEFS